MDAAETFVEYRRVQGELKKLKQELKGTPFWKVIKEEDKAKKVISGGVEKPKNKKKEEEKKKKKKDK